MYNSPKVSIIIPNYNHAEFLPQRLESIFNQTYQDFEVILLDDASKDNSFQILKSYTEHPKVSHFIVNDNNSGSPFKQWKRGIDLARGEYIWIAESDDYSDILFLEKLFDKEKEYFNIGLIYCQTKDVDYKGNNSSSRLSYTNNFKPNIWSDNFTLPGKQFISEYLKVKNVIPNASAVIFRNDREVIHSLSSDWLGMKMCGDWLFWIKFCEKYDVSFIPYELNFFRHHISSSRMHDTFNKKKRRLLEEAIIRRYLDEKEIEQEGEKKWLYKRWFEIQKNWSILNKEFYSIKIPSTGYAKFLSLYFYIKLGRRT